MSRERPLSPVRESMLVFGQPDIRSEDVDAVVETLRSRWIGTGPRTAAFERAFADYVGAPGALALSSCTSALMLALAASGVGAGDEVITTPLTFCATVNAILHAGATPVLADVDPVSMNIDPDRIEAAITPRTRALVVVHFAGRPCDMDRIGAIVVRHGLLLIEDCAHAIEAAWRGRHVGTFGDFGCYSFYATKNITTAEGGMVVGDPERLARIKVLALHGMTTDAWHRYADRGYQHYRVVDAGYKCNMTDLQAALGASQLARIEASRVVRRRIWERYQQAFADLPVERPAPVEGDARHALHLYTLLVDPARTATSRDECLAAMHAQNVGVGVHYLSLAEHPYYRERLGWHPDAWPVARSIGARTFSLPLSAALDERDVEDVVLATTRCFG